MKFLTNLIQHRYKAIMEQRVNPRDHTNKTVRKKKGVLKPNHGFTWDEKDTDKPNEC